MLVRLVFAKTLLFFATVAVIFSDLIISPPIAHHFRLDLAIFHISIFGSITRFFRQELWICASELFTLRPCEICGRSSFSIRSCEFCASSLTFSVRPKYLCVSSSSLSYRPYDFCASSTFFSLRLHDFCVGSSSFSLEPCGL